MKKNTVLPPRWEVSVIDYEAQVSKIYVNCKIFSGKFPFIGRFCEGLT